MPKKAQNLVEAPGSRQEHHRQQQPDTPLWGRAGPPPSPAVAPGSRRDRVARHRRASITETGPLSPLLAEMMRAPAAAPPLSDGKPILEAAALAWRRRKDGELSILLVSKRRSGKWGIPKGRLDGNLTFGEVAAKEAFEEAGIKGRMSPASIGMFRAKKRTPSRQHSQVIEVWVYLMEVTKCLREWPEKGQREIRWVSCETAAQQLREPMLADICHRLATA
jgi:8-oxo-dGTP pyrophosphatase MutT (NUDIX family)